MATVKPKLVTQFRLTGDCISHSRTDVEVRDVEVTIDEPVARGGTNMGLSPTETLMAALIGCTNVIGQKIAHRDGVEFEEMSVEATVDFNRDGVQLISEVDVPFPRVVLDIHVKTGADDAAIERIKADLGKFCPLAKVIRGSGTELVENWHVTRP